MFLTAIKCLMSAPQPTVSFTSIAFPRQLSATRTPFTAATQLYLSNDAPIDPSSLLYAEHEKLLVGRGVLEADLMPAGKPLEANLVKGSGGGGGFGSSSGSSGSKKSLLKAQAKSHARILREQGVVRIDNVLSPTLADSLRTTIYELRQESEDAIAAGKVSSSAVFADVLLTKHRRDMTLPIGPEWAANALHSVLVESPVGATFEAILGKEAILREWSCLMSDPQSQRQVVHPDTPWQADPVLITCFVALQDVTLDMGPTTWLPGTHTEAAHLQFQDESGPKDDLLRTTPNVVGLLPKGSCALFDSRLLHCGGANNALAQNNSRALMYCSFQNPNILNPGNPGSIRSDLIGKWTLSHLSKELVAFAKQKPNQVSLR